MLTYGHVRAIAITSQSTLFLDKFRFRSNQGQKKHGDEWKNICQNMENCVGIVGVFRTFLEHIYRRKK